MKEVSDRRETDRLDLSAVDTPSSASVLNFRSKLASMGHRGAQVPLKPHGSATWVWWSCPLKGLQNMVKEDLQGLDERWAPGCMNGAGKARQKW